MGYAYMSEHGRWLMQPTSKAAESWGLVWHGRDGTVERCAIYRDPGHAAGAVADQVTGLVIWDSLSEIPAGIDNITSWERIDET